MPNPNIPLAQGPSLSLRVLTGCLVVTSKVMHDLGDADYYANPYALLHAWREVAPVRWSPRLRRWVLTDYATARAVLLDTERFSSYVVPQLPASERTPQMQSFIDLSAQWLFFQDPPHHTAERAPVSRVLTPHAVAPLANLIDRTARQLLARINGAEFEFMAAFAHPLAASVIAALLGATPAAQDLVRGWCAEMEAASLAARDRTQWQRGLRAIAAVTRYLRECAAQRQTQALPPFMQHLCDVAPAVSDDYLAAQSLVLVFAGVETTQNLIANLVHALLQHPAQYDLIRTSNALYDAAITEALRYDTPVLGVVRRVRESVELCGVSLGAGDELVVMVGAANRDPRLYAAPDVFDLQRNFNNCPPLGLGYGRHYCTGAALARLTARLALAALLEFAPRLRLAAPVVWRDHDPIVRGPKRCRVALQP